MKETFITRELPEEAVNAIRSLTQVEMSLANRDLTESELISKTSSCEILVPTIANRITDHFFASCPNVKLIANYGVGLDHIDLSSAQRHGVLVTNTPDVLTETTANLIFSLILALTRRVVEGDRYVRKGLFSGIYPMFMLGTDIRGKVLGVYGLGRIGTALAKISHFFGMKIIYTSRKRNISAENELGANFVNFENLLHDSDVLSVNTPLTSETRGIFNYDAFTKMKRSSYFINAARGPIHIEEDLCRALKDKIIAGAALDVYENEPIINKNLLQENAVLSPHLGSASLEVRTKMGLIVARNIQVYLKNEEPPNLVTC